MTLCELLIHKLDAGLALIAASCPHRWLLDGARPPWRRTSEDEVA